MSTLTPRRTIREQVAAERFAQVTDRSISDARLAQLTERRQLEREFDVQFDPFRDGSVLRTTKRLSREAERSALCGPREVRETPHEVIR